MSLAQLESRIASLRESAATIRTGYQNQVRSIRGDGNLSDAGKVEQLAGLWEAATQRASALQEEELELMATTALSLEQTLFGTAGSSGADIISFRDARDRASRIESPEEAVVALRSAFRSKDTELAKAIVAHAVTQRDGDPVALALAGIASDKTGWPGVITLYAETYPESAPVLRDLYAIRQRENNRQHDFERAMSYVVPRA